MFRTFFNISKKITYNVKKPENFEIKKIDYLTIY